MPAVNLNGVSLAVRTEGEGNPPFLFIHDAGAGQTSWDAQVADLSRSVRCVTLDLRGHGDSSSTDPGDIPAAVADVCALIDAERLEGCVVIGHGIGALVALLVNERMADRVLGVVLVDPPLRRMDQSGTVAPAGAPFGDETPDDVRMAVGVMAERASANAVAALEHSLAGVLQHYDQVVRAADKKPFMVLWSESPAGDPAALRDATVFVRQEPLVGTGHHAQMERPAVTNALLRAFLDDIEHDPRIVR